MMQRRPVWAVIPSAFLVLFTMTQLHGGEAPRRPNVILIMADDLGYECLAANGADDYRTPNLDRLAAEGLRFERCYAQPMCTPTRNQIMTGKYNVRNYIRFDLLAPNQTTFAHLFKKAGYATCVVGKWQLRGGFDGPKHFGFDDYCLWQLTRRPPRYANPGLEVGGREVDYEQGEYGPDLVCNYALDFISRRRDQPFLLYYPMMLTHGPYQPTPDSPDWDPRAKGEQVNLHKKHFAEMVAYMDKEVGRIVDRLDEMKLRENTLVIFTADNGTAGGTQTSWKGRTVTGGKSRMTEQGMRVPLVVNWPGTVPPQQVSNELVDTTDFLPTICAAANVEIPSDLTIDGHVFLPSLREANEPPREWIYSWYWPLQAPVGAPQQLAADHRYKLFDDGKLLEVDPATYTETPLDPQKLSPEARAAKSKLQAVLDRYASARPAELLKNDPVPNKSPNKNRPLRKRGKPRAAEGAKK